MSSSAVTGTESDAVPAPTPIGRTVEQGPRVSKLDETPAQGLPPVPPAQPVPPAKVDIDESMVRPAPQRMPRRARLYMFRVDAWSVMKVAFMLSVALAIVIVTAVAAMWWLLDYGGVIATMARNIDEVIGSGTTTFDLEAVLAFDRVMGITVVIAALEIVLVSVFAGIFAVLYNLTVGITGGVEVTFTDSV